MDCPNQPEVQEFQFVNLPQVQDLTNSGGLIQAYIKGSNWQDSYNCITQLRKINKFHPEFVPDIVERYSPVILDLLNNGRPLLVRNIMRLVKELFDAGQHINVQKAVYAFLPVLIKKASTDIGSMKISAQEILTSFSANCGYEISFTITSEYCCDKNSSIAELSIKLLAVLIEKVGSGIMQLSENTLKVLMKSLSNLVDGKRQNLRNSALDICIFMCKAIRSDNFMTLMNFCLSFEEMKSMGCSMESHRQSKEKPLGLKQAVKTRKTEAFNQDFFKYDEAFIPLGEKQMNYNTNQNNGNYYNQCNQYNQDYY